MPNDARAVSRAPMARQAARALLCGICDGDLRRSVRSAIYTLEFERGSSHDLDLHYGICTGEPGRSEPGWTEMGPEWTRE